MSSGLRRGRRTDLSSALGRAAGFIGLRASVAREALEVVLVVEPLGRPGARRAPPAPLSAWRSAREAERMASRTSDANVWARSLSEEWRDAGMAPDTTCSRGTRAPSWHFRVSWVGSPPAPVT